MDIKRANLQGKRTSERAYLHQGSEGLVLPNSGRNTWFVFMQIGNAINTCVVYQSQQGRLKTK